MADIVSKSKRSKMMSGIRGRDTKPELTIRHALHDRGFRYKLHDKNLPGKPDIVLPKYSAVIFINGCFWHKHSCHLFKLPSSNTGFWENKFRTNIKKDKEADSILTELGWRILKVWECSIKGKFKHDFPELIEQISIWIKSDSVYHEIEGKNFE